MPRSHIPEGFSALVREYDMLPPGSAVVCAVSGGADSMCLLHLLSQRKDLSLAAAHFNHRLRGAEADRDEAFVRSWCVRHAIPFYQGSQDVRAEARRRGMGIEETARALRYGFLSQLAAELGSDRIATAHNAEDNAETVLLHLLRGSGLQGLTGMEPVRGKYIRPLLTTSRREIEAYLADRQIPHVEDSTNSDDRYTRNRVRHQLLPLLEEMNPGFVRRLTQAIPHLREDNHCLSGLARQLLCQAERRGEELTIPVSAIAQAPAPIGARAVRLLLAQSPGGSWDCSEAHIRSVLALCRTDSPSAQVSLPHRLTARREYDRLIFTHAPGAEPLGEFPPRQGDNPVPGTVWTVILDSPPWPGLRIRSRRQGDVLTLPSGHSRSLKRLFIDKKIPRPERERLPVVADNDGVIAVAGLGRNLSHPRHQQIAIEKQGKGEDAHDEHER